MDPYDLLTAHERYDFPTRLYADDIIEFITQVSSSLRERGARMTYDFSLHGSAEAHHEPLHFAPHIDLKGTVNISVSYLNYKAILDEDDDEIPFVAGLAFSGVGVHDLPPQRIREHVAVLMMTRKTLDDHFAKGQNRS